MSFPKSAAEPASTMPPRSANRAFILESVEVNGLEAVAVDDAGNVYGGYTNTLNLKRWTPKAAPKS